MIESYLSFADALVSMLTLTVTLFTTFGDWSLNHGMIIEGGTGVSILILVLGSRMFVQEIKMLKKVCDSKNNPL